MGNYTNPSKNLQRSQRVSLKNKGDNFEKKTSEYYHQLGIPILVHSNLLRKRGLGQLDICLFSPKMKKIFVAECKSHQGNISFNQRKRILGSLRLLSLIFNKQGVFKVIRPFAKSR